MDVVNILVALSFVALNIDVMLQNIRLRNLRESVDISLVGITLRLVGVYLLVIKFGLIHDQVLLLGQLLIAINVSIYFWQVAIYKRKRRRKTKRRK